MCQDGRYSSHRHVVNFLLEAYATKYIIAKADFGTANFKHHASQNAV